MEKNTFEKLESFSDISWKRELRLSRMQKKYHYYRLKKQCTFLSSGPLVSCLHLEMRVTVSSAGGLLLNDCRVAAALTGLLLELLACGNTGQLPNTVTLTAVK